MFARASLLESIYGFSVKQHGCEAKEVSSDVHDRKLSIFADN